ncbi:histidine kinase [Sphingomonas piscis]|uniref:histidine kinase n=1 Tax=Sphingomonas piscis TaxID=2714943 RepID=A0A6G7YRG0_9SPHN|nr:sensor histidine kinase [Sphingomonas piscis]QIK79327.1 histidine kinase [Sphingomonas piscis]
MFQLDDRRFNRLALLGVAAGFLLLLVALISAIFVFSLNQRSVDAVRQTYSVVGQLSLLEIQLERAENGRRGYLLARSDYRRQVYEENSRLVPATMAELEGLVAQVPDQKARAARVRPLIDAQLAELRRSMQLADSNRAEALAKFQAASAATTLRQIRALTGQMREASYGRLKERSDREKTTLRWMQAVLALTGLLLLAVGAASFWLVRRYTRDLTSARDRLHLLNTNLEAAVRERTTDLQRANDEIQRFAYIVSHDLRSPLVNILGFTGELEAASKSIGKLVEKADAEAPQLVSDDARMAREDLPEAITFIRSSAQKMDRLINAILKISREGRRTLAPERLEMDTIAGEVINSLSHRAVELGASIEVEGKLPDIVSDRIAVEQILSNLTENALKYLQTGRPGVIRIRGARRGGLVEYDVADNGRGIAPADHERVFELFRRAGSQDQPGEGIGLAHVRALAYRLGGMVTVESTLGEGSTFRLSLPPNYISQEGGQ